MNSQNKLSLPDLFTARRVLCIQPHYDDNDLFAGGTIARLHDRGVEIIYLTVTDDVVGVLDQSWTVDQMKNRLREEQKNAGEIIGVDRYIWLDYPDAGQYDTYQLRQDIIKQIHNLQPDFVMTVDPWLPYEAHQDHIKTGYAASEAVLLAGFPRLDPESGQAYNNDLIKGIAFYNSAWPNFTVDIDTTHARKRDAIHCYAVQFTAQNFVDLDMEMMGIEEEAAGGSNYSHGESFKIIRPNQLHGNVRTWRS